jgi:muconolactone delta-isomerase
VEYLVNMITHVPEGTRDEQVDDVRAREAAHTRELVAQGHVLRLWRPPLVPGEWRTVGLLAAGDAAELERVLASMPLRVWRTDEITELPTHPNDPGPGAAAELRLRDGESPLEFLVTFTPAVPDGTPAEDVAEATHREAESTSELAREGYLVRLWAPPAGQGPSPALGLWRADDEAQMQAILESLPLYRYAKTQTTPLTPHPSDPATQASG